MGMWLLVVGVLLWSLPHMFKRLAPEARARMGDGARGVVAVSVVASIVLMTLGYKWAEFHRLYDPPLWGGHLNNLLVLIGFYVFGINMAKGALSQKIRHPMLTGVAIWALAHLLVRGDLASVILFGGLALWAVAAMLLINAREPGWAPAPPKGGFKRDLVAVPIVLVTYAAVGWIHGWLGPWPFG